MSFGDFPNQKPIVELLQKSLRCGRLGHAYLFSGGAQSEMEQIAATLAKTLNCQNPPSRSEGGLPIDCCDQCSSCRRIASHNHPDVQWVRPESKSRVITIDQVRDSIQTINLKPSEAAYKVSIFTAADRMNTQAANAFLKTLEEPPARSVIILTTTNLERVLETILSRCLRLHFATDARLRLDPAEESWLESINAMAATRKKSLFSRYRLLGLVSSRLATVKEQIAEQLTAQSPLERYPDAEPKMREKWEDELAAAIEAEYRRRRGELLLLLQWWLRDIWVQTQEAADAELALPKFQESTRSIASRLETAAAAENLSQLERLQRQLHTNVQEALALEVGLLKLKL